MPKTSQDIRSFSGGETELISEHIKKWESYRDSRKGTYEFRARTRYKAVADALFRMGLADFHSVMDVGAGSCQFGRYLREVGFRGLYIPVDAVIDGTDLETWTPAQQPRANFVVAIEVIEHVSRPMRLLSALRAAALRGIAITTPNPEAVDVLRCDPTHVSVVSPEDLKFHGMNVVRRSWFGVPDDTLLAWREIA